MWRGGSLDDGDTATDTGPAVDDMVAAAADRLAAAAGTATSIVMTDARMFMMAGHRR